MNPKYLNDWILERIAAIRSVPDAWGTNEAVEAQLLTLLEVHAVLNDLSVTAVNDLWRAWRSRFADTPSYKELFDLVFDILGEEMP